MQDSARRHLDPLLEGLDRELGAGYAAVLYGSAARGEFVEGVSDVNLLILCDSLEPALLRRLSGTLAALAHRQEAPPLLMEPAEWSRAADVFPIEITDMQVAHEILRGSDPVTALRVRPEELRAGLEREFRGKLLRLRQAYAVYAGEPRALEAVAVATVSSVASLFRVALRLYQPELPTETQSCLAAAGAAMGIDTGSVYDLWQRRRRDESAGRAQSFAGYLAAVNAAVRVMDQFTRGGQ
ncbi:MAG: hypothetical protein ACT4PM_03015 [Gemmatimonadales bacterium]